VNDVISRGLNVYTEVVRLAEASEINSLRKVFGEAYPDPVRLISVGQSIQDLLANPTNPDWFNSSVEFCGGTHLTNTSKAENFAIIEESGIAKGIRRIVGFTRGAAKNARANAQALFSNIQRLDAESGGPELIAGFKQLKKDVDVAVVSVVDKDRMRNMLNKIFEKIKAYNKANASTRLNNAIQSITALAQKSLEQNKPVIVATIDCGNEARKIHDKLVEINPKASSFIIAMDDDGEKIKCGAFINPAHLSQGMSAKEWTEYCIKLCGTGKGGGKAEQANAVFAAAEKTVEEIGEHAQKYGDRFGGVLVSLDV